MSAGVRLSILGLAVSVAWLVAGCGGGDSARPGGPSPEQPTVVPVQADGTARVLIGLRDTPGAVGREIVRGVGGRVKCSYRLIPAIAATIPARGIAALRNNPNIEYVEGDGIVTTSDEFVMPWGVNHIGAPVVHDAGNVGAGVKVAIIDTGVDYDHIDLRDNYVAHGWDFVNSDEDPMDDHGHGTHVAGTAAAVGRIVGVAPGADIHALKVLDASGSGYYSDTIAALQWCVDNGVHVANMSLGGGQASQALETACNNAFNAGVLLVAAAGNNGSHPRFNMVDYPARYASVIAVAATDSNNSRASFSSTGSVDISAPGVSIYSTWLAGKTGSGVHQAANGYWYATSNGTSMAAPHVAGVGALVIASGLTVADAVRARLLETADHLGRADHFGAGLVNAPAAAGSGEAPYPTPAPTVTAVAPDSGTNDGPVGVTIGGTGFRAGAVTRLTRAGQADINGTGVEVVGETEITCTFDITGAEIGAWNVVVTNDDDQSGQLDNGFEVLPADTSPPYITGWDIRVTHGEGVGEVVSPVAGGYVEPRLCGIGGAGHGGAPTVLHVHLNEPLDPATVGTGSISIVGARNGDCSDRVSALTLQGDGSVIRIAFNAALPNPDTYTLTLSEDICDLAGNPLSGERSIVMVALIGDANSSGTVTSGDMLAVRTHIGQPLTALNARYDINLSGTITSGDMLAIQTYIGDSAP